ncbi:histone-lysine N-methyltransferase SETDB1-like isoform X3 [Symsagittifera roscoffensis]|uniref:histone-lysine N-methyltransferase SETDB1-like isoform X3 n=1 Tax=Symsagittifera roscoffensis TaxID=84072 RepID=UPI00307B9CB4
MTDHRQVAEYLETELKSFDAEVGDLIKLWRSQCAEALQCIDTSLEEKALMIGSLERRIQLADKLDGRCENVRIYRQSLTDALSKSYTDKIKMLKTRGNLQTSLGEFDEMLRLDFSKRITVRNLLKLMESKPENYQHIWNAVMAELLQNAQTVEMDIRETIELQSLEVDSIVSVPPQNKTALVEACDETTEPAPSVLSSEFANNASEVSDVVDPMDSKTEAAVSEKKDHQSDDEIEVVPVEASAVEQKKLLKTHLRTNTPIHRGISVFGFKRKNRKWMKGNIVSRTPGPEGEDLYRVKYRDANQEHSYNQAKQIAFGFSLNRVTYAVGSRVLALFSHDAHEGKGRLEDCPNKRTIMETGVIGETPNSKVVPGKNSDNKNRYLVFFDTGQVQYIPHGSVFHLLTEDQSEMWKEVVDKEMATFLQVYFHFHPKRFLLQDPVVGKPITVKDYKRWSQATITEVDCNIIKVTFEDADGEKNRFEWIFRGSDRIESVKRYITKMLQSNPLKSVSNDAENKNSSAKSVSSVTNRGSTSALSRVIHILSSSEDESEEQSESLPVSDSNDASRNAEKDPANRIIGSKEKEIKAITSTTGNSTPAPSERTRSTSKHDDTEDLSSNPRWFGGKKWATEFIPEAKRTYAKWHKKCSYKCLQVPSAPKDEERGAKCLLQTPVFAGFEREFCHTKAPAFKGDNPKVAVVYRSPCGKRLRNIEELGAYLLSTKCSIGIDKFCFDPLIANIFDSVELETETFLVKEDVSHGVEKRPIRVVNKIDDSVPIFGKYILERQPSAEVIAMMKTDPGFQACCDCTDNCKDKKKCACAQLTIETTRMGRNGKSKRKLTYSNAGFNHRRLTTRHEFGLYECNSNCSCNKETCYNSVVQLGLQVRLELFMTEKKGWGVRSLDYIPAGTFICNYSGELMTKFAAEMAAMVTGDTYLMNLDFMEKAGTLKEDEDGSQDDIEEDEEDYELDEEDDEQFLRRNRRANISLSQSANSDPSWTPGKITAAELSSSAEDLPSVIAEEEGLEDIRPASDDEEADGPGFGMDLDDLSDLDETNGATGNDSLRDGVLLLKGGKKRQKSGDNNSETDHNSEDDTSLLVLDSMNSGNIARFFNHSCNPNLYVQNVFIDSHDKRFPYTGFFVGETHIKPGDELGWDYGYEAGSVEGKILFCHCGAGQCQNRLL